MNYMNLHVTCEKKYRSSRSIIKKIMKNSVIYENRENKLKRSSLIYKFVFFLCSQHFCTWFCHRPTATAVGRAPALASRSCPPAFHATAPAGRNLPCHAVDAPQPQPPTPRSGLALACSLALSCQNAALNLILRRSRPSQTWDQSRI
jgi:hypothetical protein